jgi:serine/threonine protein kinase
MAKFLNYSEYFLTAQGTSACTYGSSNPEDRMVQIKNKNIAERNSKLIQDLGLLTINGTREYLIYPNANIEPVPNTLFRGPCDVEGNLRVVKIPNGGKDLHSLEVPSGDIYAFFTGFINIFEALLLLHSNDIAHLDVKPMNMVGKKNPDGTYNLRVIDFGFSKKTDKESDNSEFYEYNKDKCTKPHNYRYWSYDLRLLNPDLFENLCGGNIDDDIKEYRQMIYDAFYTEFMISTLDTELVRSFKDFMVGSNIWLTLLKSDVFALGLSLYKIWQRLTGYGMSNLDKLIYNTERDIRMGISIKAGEQVKLPEGWTMREAVGLNKVYFHNVTHNLIFWDIKKIKTCDAEIEASNKVFELVKKMCNPDPFRRLNLRAAKQEYITIVLPAIQRAYSIVPDLNNKARVVANLAKKLDGGSRHRRKRTRRNNKKYVKAKKTRASTK